MVACPTCGATVEWAPAARWRPFCSERCKMIDLGAWASEAYRVQVAEAPLPVFALGGLTRGDLDVAIAHGAHGIALRRAAWPEV